jgi:hypothetical protein
MRSAILVLVLNGVVSHAGSEHQAIGSAHQNELHESNAPGTHLPRDVSVILISVDGLRPDAITTHGPRGVPAFYRLRREGAFTDNARTAPESTSTLPNHVGMITGRLVSGLSGHGWTWNKDPLIGANLHRNKGEYLESVFSVAHDYGLRTALYASKSKFSLFELSYDAQNGRPDSIGEDNGRDKIDVFIQETLSENVVDDLEDAMKRESFDFLMVHIRAPDTAGHGFTWNISRPSFYMDAVKKADELLADILEQIEKNATWKGRTYIVLTADHGGLSGSKVHDAILERENFTIPFYVWGPGIPAGADLYRLNRQSRKDPGVLNPSGAPAIAGPITLPAAPPISGLPSPATDLKLPALVRPPEFFASTDLPPIRNADAGNLCLSLLGLPPIPGSTVNTKQDIRVAPLASEPLSR